MAAAKSDQDVSLEVFADVAAECYGATDPNATYDAAAARGFDRGTWIRATQRWAGSLYEEPDSALNRRYGQLLREGLARICGDVPPLDFEAYVAATVDEQSGVAEVDVARRLGFEDVKAYALAAFRCGASLEEDPWQRTYFNLRVRKEVAERTGQPPQPPLEWIPGQMVRRRQCHRCGGVKTTPPATAYIYCDYCGAFFDYDTKVIYQDPTALDPDEVTEALNQVTGVQLRNAREAGDREEYTRIYRWRIGVVVEVTPASYSPRVRNPEYRQRLIDDLLVPWQVVTWFDPAYLALRDKVLSAEARAASKPTLDHVLNLLKKSRRLWQLEIAILTREGVLERHPDEVDATLLEYMAASQFVRPYLGFLDMEEGATLMRAAGVQDEYVPAPRVELDNLTCGQCHQPLKVPAGSRRRLCEHCGYLLELAERRVACTQCGASVALPAGATAVVDYDCAFCGTHWTL